MATNPMTENSSHKSGGPPTQDEPALPIRIVRGNASPEELSAFLALVAVLAAESSGDQNQTGHTSSRGGAPPRSAWSSPERMVRKTYPHKPGGWRESASAR